MANPAAQAHCRCQSPSDRRPVNETGAVQRPYRAHGFNRLLNDRRLVDSKSGDRYVKAAPTIDPLLERRPTGSKAPAARPRLPTFGHSWGRASEIRAERELMGSCA